MCKFSYVADFNIAHVNCQKYAQRIQSRTINIALDLFADD